jgi:hypothetical protein
MGVLAKIDADFRVHLLGEVLIGRGADHHVRLLDKGASSPHAGLRWDGKRWIVRDLGSTNGTFVDGKRLDDGDRFPLRTGAVLRFGVDAERYELVSADAPRPLLLDVQTGATCAADGQLIVLPSEDAPRATFFEDAKGHWICEQEEGNVSLVDRQVIVVDGCAWQLRIPSEEAQTLKTTNVPAIDAIALRFGVSRDEEHIDLDLVYGDEVTRVPPRAFHYLLLTLARARACDSDPSEAERGYVDRDELCRMLGSDVAKLNVEIFRARRQFSELGVLGAAAIIERRVSSAALRLGVKRLHIARL